MNVCFWRAWLTFSRVWRSIVERFRTQTSVRSQSEIHPRARLKTVGGI